MLPIADENPTRIRPIVNWTIIIITIITFFWQTSGGTSFFTYTLYNYGLVPARLLTGEGYITLLTNIFLHAGWAHLLGNMLFLAIFGDNIEDCCGHLRFLGFYITSGVTASIFWMITVWGSNIPAVGASGAISGVLGAYFILYPNVRIRTLMGIGIFWRVIRIPAYVMIGLWFLYQLILANFPLSTGVAYWAHIGGFIAGMALASIIKPRIRKPQAYYELEYSR
jgi:membrane associated rhomboid family serine protease